jgi:hypothetical protein
MRGRGKCGLGDSTRSTGAHAVIGQRVGAVYWSPMRRLRRWAFNGATLLSAMLVAATAIFWFRSLSRIEGVNYLRTDGTLIGLGTHCQGLGFTCLTNVPQVYAEAALSLCPHRGWSVSSHREGVAESITDTSEPNTEFTGHPAGPKTCDMICVSVVYQWSPPGALHAGQLTRLPFGAQTGVGAPSCAKTASGETCSSRSS